MILAFITSNRAEKSAEAFHEQKIKGICVPEVSDHLRPISFQLWGVIRPFIMDCSSSCQVIITTMFLPRSSGAITHISNFSNLLVMCIQFLFLIFSTETESLVRLCWKIIFLRVGFYKQWKKIPWDPFLLISCIIN